MKVIEAMRIALRALAANKLRSILTMLGIIIGVGAVIALMSIGRGVEKYVTDQFAGLGSNLLFVAPGQISDGPPALRANPVKSLTLGDMGAIGDRTQVPHVSQVAAEFQTRATVERNGKSVSVQASATTPSYPNVRSWNTTPAPTFPNWMPKNVSASFCLAPTLTRNFFLTMSTPSTRLSRSTE
jgi:putative ABC transport system permease protein